MIKLAGVQKNYSGFKLDVDVEVRPGFVTGLVGKNGAGKSTAFKTILGIVEADGGEVELLGKKIGDITIKDKERLGVALAESGFSGYFSINDIIPILKSMYHKFDETQFRSQCIRFELPFGKRISQMSTGMKAKLKVLVALSHEADLLILDEPTSGLDVMARNEILGMLREYMAQKEDRSILISSHISSDLESLCDDFYMIDDGKIVLHEETDVLLSDYGILKLTPKQYEEIDHRYIAFTKKEGFGYACLTREKQYYMDNYPDIVIEKGNIDDVIVIMIGGEKA